MDSLKAFALLFINSSHIRSFIMNDHEANGASVGPFPVPAWIDNAPSSAEGLKTFDVVNGKTGETVHQAYSANLDTVKAVTESSWNAFQEWRRSPLQKRQQVLSKFADILEAQSEEINETTILENSGDPMFAQFTHSAAVSMVRQVACSVTSIQGSAIIPFDDASVDVHGFVFKEPVGPVLMIIP